MNVYEPWEKSTLLIVDDQPTYIQTLAKLLKEDYHIQVATRGSKALEIAAGENPPDLILLDIEMPEMSGHQVCQQLKDKQETRNIPVIFVTARDAAEDEEVGFNLGAVDYISKPYHPVVVRARVRNQTRRKRAEEKISQYAAEMESKNKELELIYNQLDRELEKARRIHEKTLPASIPRIKDISISSHYQPAQKIGGDFYDIIQNEEKLIIYLSDVTGHSMEGSMLSIFVKEAVNSFISLKPEEIEPEKILVHLYNQYNKQGYPLDYFICIFLAVLDLKTCQFAYTGAGFQTPQLVDTGRERFQLLSQGLPISSAVPREIIDLKSKTIQITRGTTILLTTDGLVEQASGDELYGERLEKVFYENSHLSTEALVSRINQDFLSFNDSLQGDDDITLCVIKM